MGIKYPPQYESSVVDVSVILWIDPAPSHEIFYRLWCIISANI
jgi:phosphopantetheinyl transferase